MFFKSIRRYALDDGDICDSGKFRYLDEVLPVMKEQVNIFAKNAGKNIE